MFNRVVFQPVRLRQSVAYTCPRCTKNRTKIVCVEHTINPFNKNADGTVKTRQQVYECVKEEHKRRVEETKSGITCNKCKDEIVAEREAKRKAERGVL